MSPNKTALSLGRFNQFLPYFFKRGCLPSKYRPIWPKAKQDKRGFWSCPALIVLVLLLVLDACVVEPKKSLH
jgi:hypothetical protein